MKFYVVTFGTASINMEMDDITDNTVNAYCGCVGCFKDKKDALKAMTKCKDQKIEEHLSWLDEDDEDYQINLEMTNNNITVYGDESSEYYEIDFNNGEESSQTYIRLEEIIL